jgi:integrase
MTSIVCETGPGNRQPLARLPGRPRMRSSTRHSRISNWGRSRKPRKTHSSTSVQRAEVACCIHSSSSPFILVCYSELRLLRWDQVDLVGRVITVGASKMDAGTGRKVPLNDRAFRALLAWAQAFPDRKSGHYVFPSEHYGIATNKRTVCVSSTEPSTPTTSVQEAWQLAKKRGDVRCRRRSAGTRPVMDGGPGVTP